MIISLHIPKTAGKSFKASLIKSYGSNIVFDYGANPQKQNKFSLLNQLLVFKLKLFSGSEKIVHGHFCLDKYKSFPSSCPRICFAREPLSLFTSFYDYVNLKFREDPKLQFFYSKVIKSKLEDFLLSSYTQNFYSRMFGSFDYRKFYFIGVVEKYEQSLNIYNKLFGTNLFPEYRNKTDTMGKRISDCTLLSEDFKTKFKSFHKFNYEFYNYALNRLEDKKYDIN